MKTVKLGSSNLMVPSIAVGCMRLNSMSMKDTEFHIKTALEHGANFFDHADIYGGGACEELFSSAIDMNPQIRENMIIQSKCGIIPGKMFDFSKQHILSSVDKILARLKTEYLDILLLHRPDALIEPEEVASAFDQLYCSGKVKYFGVSNQKPMQIELLKKYVKQPLIVNQLQLSITNASMISQGMNINMLDMQSVDRDGSILDYCRLNDITIQPWSPFQYGFFEGTFLENKNFLELNKKLNELAERYHVTNTSIAIAWILRHPANMQPVVGTTNKERLEQCIKACDIQLTREEWYELYLAAGHRLP